MVVYITRVLIQQVLHLIPTVEHEHQRDDGEPAAGACSQVAYAAAGVGFDGGNELLHVTAGHCLPRLCIYLASIGIRRIMREVATDDEEVFIVEPRLQHLGHSLQFGIVVGGDNNRYDGWHFFRV